MRKIYLDKNQLIEYNGDFYTPEELAEKLGGGDIEVILTEEKSWFEKALDDQEIKH